MRRSKQTLRRQHVVANLNVPKRNKTEQPVMRLNQAGGLGCAARAACTHHVPRTKVPTTAPQEVCFTPPPPRDDHGGALLRVCPYDTQNLTAEQGNSAVYRIQQPTRHQAHRM